MSNLKNVQPLAEFNWNEFENGSPVEVSKITLEKAYAETLNKVSEHQVVEGKIRIFIYTDGYKLKFYQIKRINDQMYINSSEILI